MLSQCNSDCGACFTSPQPFSFEIVDQASGENLFANGTYDSGAIQITNSLDNGAPVDFTFISENNQNLIQINSIGWETEIVDLKFAISDYLVFDFYVDADRKMGECCSHTTYNKIEITGAEFELDPQTGIYKILVE